MCDEYKTHSIYLSVDRFYFVLCLMSAAPIIIIIAAAKVIQVKYISSRRRRRLRLSYSIVVSLSFFFFLLSKHFIHFFLILVAAVLVSSGRSFKEKEEEVDKRIRKILLLFSFIPAFKVLLNFSFFFLKKNQYYMVGVGLLFLYIFSYISYCFPFILSSSSSSL